MKILKSLIVILSIVTISSCATNSKVKQLDLSNEKILVVSAFEDKFVVKVIGTTMFTNHYKEIDSIKINANKLIFDAIKLIDSENKFKYYEGDIDFNFSGGNWYTGQGFNIKKHIPDLEKIRTNCNCRYILLVATENIDDRIFFTNQFFNNYGVTQRSFMGKKDNRVFVSMKIALVDMEIKKKIDQRSFLGSVTTNKYSNKKLHELDDSEFLIVTEILPDVFNLTIDKLFEFMGL